jgi:hypothetical protein
MQYLAGLIFHRHSYRYSFSNTRGNYAEILEMLEVYLEATFYRRRDSLFQLRYPEAEVLIKVFDQIQGFREMRKSVVTPFEYPRLAKPWR